MKPKKTLTNWLTNRYTLIIRDEENFAEKRTYGFTYTKIIVFGISIFIISMTLSYYIITGVLSNFLDPRLIEADTDRKIIILSAKVDSLAGEVNRKDKYIFNLKNIITGKSPVNTAPAKVTQSELAPTNVNIQLSANSKVKIKSENN